LLTRAWDPTQGRFAQRSAAVRLSEATLRQAMSVVPQRVHLFSATLRDNLLLAAPGPAMTRSALEKVGLEKLLEDGGLNAGWAKAGASFPAANCAGWPLPARCSTMRR
jgi:ATP-binding cassette subfamily C protein CydC